MAAAQPIPGRTAKPRLTWRLPVYAALAATAAIAALALGNPNEMYLGYVFFFWPAVLVAGVGVLLFAAVRKSVAIALLVLSFWAASAILMYADYKLPPTTIRSSVRWLLWSSDYKRAVLSQPASAQGYFQHIEWDAW